MQGGMGRGSEAARRVGRVCCKSRERVSRVVCGVMVWCLYEDWKGQECSGKEDVEEWSLEWWMYQDSSTSWREWLQVVVMGMVVVVVFRCVGRAG